jgi:hypothetical protein
LLPFAFAISVGTVVGRHLLAHVSPRGTATAGLVAAAAAACHGVAPSIESDAPEDPTVTRPRLLAANTVTDVVGYEAAPGAPCRYPGSTVMACWVGA